MSSLARFARAWTSSAAFSRSPPTTYSTGRRSTSSSRGAVHYSIRARACRSWAPAARTPSPPDAARQDARECVRGAAPRRRNIFHVFNVHLLCHCCNLNPMHVVPSARALFPSRPWAAAASRDRSRRDQWNRITKYLGLARRRARALSPSGLGPFAWPRGPAADTARRGGGTRSVNHQRRRRRRLAGAVAMRARVCCVCTNVDGAWRMGCFPTSVIYKCKVVCRRSPVVSGDSLIRLRSEQAGACGGCPIVESQTGDRI